MRLAHLVLRRDVAEISRLRHPPSRLDRIFRQRGRVDTGDVKLARQYQTPYSSVR